MKNIGIYIVIAIVIAAIVFAIFKFRKRSQDPDLVRPDEQTGLAKNGTVTARPRTGRSNGRPNASSGSGSPSVRRDNFPLRRGSKGVRIRRLKNLVKSRGGSYTVNDTWDAALDEPMRRILGLFPSQKVQVSSKQYLQLFKTLD